MLKFGNTKNFQTSGIKVLVYGRPGIGKTTLCATAPAPIILSAESGLLSLRSREIDTITVESIEDLKEAYEFFASSQEAQRYQTICLDSISEIAELVLAKEKTINADARKAYGTMQDTLVSVIRSFRDLPNFNVYFSCKMEKSEDDLGTIKFMPSFPGRNLAQNVGYFFDEEFAMVASSDQEGNVYRWLQTRADTQYEAKDRAGVLDAYEAPNLTSIFNKIKGIGE